MYPEPRLIGPIAGSFLAIICCIGGILYASGLQAIFLDKAKDVLLQGTEYASTILGGMK